MVLLQIKFCPRCHRKVELPKWMNTANIKAENGITLQCGYCKKGKVTIKLSLSTPVEVEAR